MVDALHGLDCMALMYHPISMPYPCVKNWHGEEAMVFGCACMAWIKHIYPNPPPCLCAAMYSMEGCSTTGDRRVLLIGATNRPEVGGRGGALAFTSNQPRARLMRGGRGGQI